MAAHEARGIIVADDAIFSKLDLANTDRISQRVTAALLFVSEAPSHAGDVAPMAPAQDDG